jgi:hypothetical protein
VGGYDSHVTTEVWLPGPKIWALSDPTFDGWWSDNLSPQGLYPISARVVQYRVRHGQADALVWHQGGSLFLPPWVYYTDVRYVFRVLDYLLFVGGRTSPNYIVDNPTSVAWCCVAMTSTNLTLLPPDKTFPITWVTVASPSQAEADFPTNPPPYGESRVATLHVTADALGRGHWTIPGLNGRCGFEIVRGPAVGDWVVHAGADYPLAHLPAGVSLSPVLCSTTRSVDVLHAAPGASFTIEVWLGKTFKAPA